jgi:hypothetical protein
MKMPPISSEKRPPCRSGSGRPSTIGAMSVTEMRAIWKPWTPADDERIRLFVAQGASIVRAAAALQRRQDIVRVRARKLGCPFPPQRIARQKWANTPNNPWRDR